MFKPRSFKKFQRRIRSPLTLLKKLAKKLSRTGKQQHKDSNNHHDGDTGERSVRRAPTDASFASPEITIDLDIPSSPTTDDSASIPHTPTTLSPDPNPVVVEPTLTDISVAENEPFVLSGEEFGLLRTPSIGKMSTRFSNSKDHGTVETTQVVESVQEEKESTPEPVTVSDAVQDVEIPKQDSIPSEKSTPLEDPTSPPPVIVEAAKEDTPSHQPSEPSPPQTPIKKILKPSGIPRKSFTLDSQTPPKTPPKTTPETPPIISELQASVQRRLQKHKLELAQKRKEELELRLSVVPDAECVRKVVLGAGSGDRDRDSVLREVRSWRKQRESRTKSVYDDDTAKLTAYREAMSREEIMVDLMSTVQSRSLRSPPSCVTDEKRQTVLEELFARRVRVG